MLKKIILNEATIKLIRKTYLEIRSIRKTSKALGISRTMVEKYTKGMLPGNQGFKAKPPEVVQEIRSLYIDGLRIEDIAQTVGANKETVSKYIADMKPTPKKDFYLDPTNTPSYILGIIWSIGGYDKDRDILVLLHKNRYFLDQVQEYSPFIIYRQVDQNKEQYVLKIPFPADLFRGFGWAERNADERNIPALEDYQDFLRAYLEIHSSVDILRTKRGKRLRLRIYGNHVLIQSINSILAEQAGVLPKKPQPCPNGKTSVLYFQNAVEIDMILNYVFGTPFCPKYWDKYKALLEELII